jgi:hypothetical protein
MDRDRNETLAGGWPPPSSQFLEHRERRREGGEPDACKSQQSRQIFGSARELKHDAEYPGTALPALKERA